VSTFVATVITVTAISTVGTVFFIAPPAVTGRVPMDVAYLTGDVDVGRGPAVATATTIITATTVIIIATGAIVTVLLAWTIIAILLAWTILAPAVIIAGALILARPTITVVVARTLILAIVLARTTVIIAWARVTASHVCRGSKGRFFSGVLPIKRLDLSKKLSKGGVGVGVDSSAEIVVVATESLQDIVENLIIIKRFSCSSKFSGDTLHLGEIFVGR
jgi:hypothetical protein